MKKIYCVLLFVGCASGVMLTHDCPYGEIYKSCMFYAEITCWKNQEKSIRVKTPAKRLSHCWGGCVCNHDSVRAYPNGPCVIAHNCVDGYFLSTLVALPPDFVYL